jgi:hypothetical protein
VRALVAEIRGALDAYPKEAVAEILTYVFKEYVVEAPLPLGQSALAVVEARSELEGLSFAKLIEWLQLHLDMPELSLFEVQGERVQVRVGGRALPLEAGAARPEPLPPQAAPPPAPTPAAAPSQPAPRMPVTPTPPVATQPGATPPAAPAQPNAAPQQKTTEPGEDSTRFSLLEVD